MSNRRRSFSTPTATTADPIVFDLDGTRRSNGEAWSETFTCIPEAPAGVLDDLAASVTLDDRGNQRYNQVSLLRFIRGVLVEDDTVRFDDLVHDKDRIVGLDILGEIMMWLATELVGRPTVRLSSSPAGPPPTTPTSTDDSPSPGPTLVHSALNVS